MFNNAAIRFICAQIEIGGHRMKTYLLLLLSIETSVLGFWDIEVSVEKISLCPGTEDINIMDYKNIVITKVNKDNYQLNADLTIKEPIDGIINAEYVFTKCTIKSNPATCEHSLKQEEKNVCKSLGLSGLSMILKAADIEPHCPVPAKDYKMTDFKFALPAALEWVLSSAEYFKININATRENELILCVDVDLGVSKKSKNFRRQHSFTA